MVDEVFEEQNKLNDEITRLRAKLKIAEDEIAAKKRRIVGLVIDNQHKSICCANRAYKIHNLKKIIKIAEDALTQIEEDHVERIDDHSKTLARIALCTIRKNQ